jgi:malate dehydrogenase (oxaloacetate-decarboxylating)
MARIKKDFGIRAIAAHRKLGGKIEVVGKVHLKTREDFSLYYTPGVGAVSSYLAKHPKDAKMLTMKKNTVAIISDGSAVLGLGNIGPYGALPVMEGKALIFKELAGVDAFPIVLDTQNPKKIVEIVAAIAPGFGGIHLEDIKAPECFYVEDELKRRLDIPVMHDDQHGTAIVVTAALMNAAKVVKKDFKKLKVVILGAGAAGTAVAKLLLKAGVMHVVILDRQGIIQSKRTDLSVHKRALAHATSRHHGLEGNLVNALSGADAVIGVSGPNLIAAKDIWLMAPRAIVFALANPVPEIMPELAKKAGAAVVASGRSDFPNQVNNALAFPGVFRGALDHGVSKITDNMKLAAARALARLVARPTADHIIPSPLDKRVVPAVAKAIQ